jgi:hypothetical protein
VAKFVLPKKKHAEFKQDLLIGLNIRALAEKYGFAANSPRLIKRLANSVGVNYVGSGVNATWAPQLRAWWAEGVPLDEIIARTQCSPSSIRDRIRALELPLRNIDFETKKVHWDDTRRAEFEADWRADVPMNELVKKYGRSAENLEYYRRRAGWPRRAADIPKGAHYSPEEDAEIRRLYMKGATAAQIANSPKLALRDKGGIDQRIRALGLSRAAKRGRVLPETIAPQIAAFLATQTEPVSFELIRNRLNIRDSDLVRAAIKQLRRANTITSPARGAYQLVR